MKLLQIALDGWQIALLGNDSLYVDISAMKRRRKGKLISESEYTCLVAFSRTNLGIWNERYDLTWSIVHNINFLMMFDENTFDKGSSGNLNTSSNLDSRWD